MIGILPGAVITPIVESDYSLERLLEGVTEKNIHTEVDTGDSVGNKACSVLSS